MIPPPRLNHNERSLFPLTISGDVPVTVFALLPVLLGPKPYPSSIKSLPLGNTVPLALINLGPTAWDWLDYRQ